MAKPPIVTTLAELRELSPTVKHFRFAFDAGDGFPFKAGQFLMLHVPQDGQPPVRRAYSICSPPHDAGAVEIVVKRVEKGLASNYLFGLSANQRVTVDGPYGAFVLPTPLPKHLVFVCTGTGIAPFRAQIQTLFKTGVDATTRLTLIFGVRYEDEVLYDEEWRGLAKTHPNFRFIPTISRPRHMPAPWTGETGYVQTKLAHYAPPTPETAVFICGLWDMISAVEKTCRELGYTKKQIHYERYD
ncbi:MAG: FAD-dependent oxidoreductase [Candidatus Omnitrophica bacterium]|nr:FAD-dependent oxidoreductase [Candidatus Omnitrophota bacterium]